MFNSILNTTTAAELNTVSVLVCIVTALVMGLIIALVYRIQGDCSKSFTVTLILLPALVEIVIMVVNGNLGAGVAVAGAFSLVRFRSIPGSAKEISFIFFSMVIGLSCGMGYIGFSVLFTIIISMVYIILSFTKFSSIRFADTVKDLRVTIPEILDYTGVFDDIFKTYLKKVTLERVKTTNLGSMFELTYRIELKNPADEKKFIDEIRCRNGNLTIICGKVQNNELYL